MRSQQVECLGCGSFRRVTVVRFGHIDPEECPRCGYLGWAEPYDVTEDERRALRERPVAERRSHLHLV